MKEHLESSHPDESQEECDYDEPEEMQARLRLKQIKQKLRLMQWSIWGKRSWAGGDHSLGCTWKVAWCRWDAGPNIGAFSVWWEFNRCQFTKMTHLWLSSEEGKKCGQVLINVFRILQGWPHVKMLQNLLKKVSSYCSRCTILKVAENVWLSMCINFDSSSYTLVYCYFWSSVQHSDWQ